MTAEDHEWLTAIQSDYEVGDERWQAIQGVLDREPLVQEVIRLTRLCETETRMQKRIIAIAQLGDANRKLAEWKP